MAKMFLTERWKNKTGSRQRPSRNEGTGFQGQLELRRGTGAREHLEHEPADS